MDTKQAAQPADAGRIEELAQQNDAEGLIRLVRERDEELRREAARQVQKALSARAGTTADLDLYLAVMRAVIDAGIADAGTHAAGLAEDSDMVKDFYNALSYNFSADLADCWPGDEAVREERHFQAGLAAAEDCIRWRNELGKPPRSFSIAYWAKGMHLLSLGHYSGAVKCFSHAIGFAIRAAEDAAAGAMTTDLNAPARPPEAQLQSFDVILNTGYLGLAEALLGEGPGLARYDEACASFRVQAGAGGDDADDARFGLQQLEYVRTRLNFS